MKLYKCRTTYWNNSTVAKKIRRLFGNPSKPYAATLQGWRQWRIDSKEASRFGHWVTEEFLCYVQDFIYYPYDVYRHIKSTIRAHREDHHLIDTGLKKGVYHEVSDRMLHGMFGLLVDFIEKEKAEEGGTVTTAMNHLIWKMSLTYDTHSGLDRNDPLIGKPTPQAWAAAEQAILYNWWKNVRPNRKDPYEEFALPNSTTDIGDILDGGLTPENVERYAKIDELQKAYDSEDQEMLLRLVRIRQSLWT